MRIIAALVLVVFSFTGCYVATIDTGKSPSAQVIKKPFASGWLFGLIPPSTVKTAAECPNGIAKVETQLSFVNMLVANLTLGIYTPMQITVTCADKSLSSIEDKSSLLVCETLEDADVEAVFTRAAEMSKELGVPVFVQLPSAAPSDAATVSTDSN